jgi:ADP-ribose pyrophosphatase YjhB (NUDIX family)
MGGSGYYSKHKKFYVAVDCIIFGFDQDGLKLLLIKRNFQPMKGQWSLMGGFLQKDESLDDASRTGFIPLTGLREVYLEQLYTYGEVHRDPAKGSFQFPTMRLSVRKNTIVN